MNSKKIKLMCKAYLSTMGTLGYTDAFIDKEFIDGVLRLLKENEQLKACEYMCGEYSHNSCPTSACGE